MSKTTNFMLFIFGIAIGSVSTWTYVKKKYERIAQEEIDSVKEVFLKKTMIRNDIEISDENDISIDEYDEKVKGEGYTNYPNCDSDKEDDEYFIRAYVISPDEFGEDDEYERFSLTYYADEILADDNNEIVEDIEATVSYEALTHFGEYEDDSVFVRNDILKCDYEILLDHRKYSDVVKMKPKSTEG